MKRTRLIMMVIALLVNSAVVSGNAQQAMQLKQNVGNHYGGNQNCSIISNGIIPSTNEIALLQFMREEEKLARDVYAVMYAQWAQPLFNNIAQSEQTHMDQVKCFLDAYQLTDPVQAHNGKFTHPELQTLYDNLVQRGKSSRSEALRVGAMIEEVDIRDLQDAIAKSSIAEVNTMYSNLMAGSENHLRAFVSNLLSLGERYSAQVLAESTVTNILNGDRTSTGTGVNIHTLITVNNNARFTLKADTGVAMGGSQSTFSQQTRLMLTAAIQTDPQHIGQRGQLINVALFQPSGSRVMHYYQLNAQGKWQNWNGDLQSLNGAFVNMEAMHNVSIFDGTFQNAPGYYQILSGYLLDNGNLIFGSQPLSFGIF